MNLTRLSALSMAVTVIAVSASFAQSSKNIAKDTQKYQADRSEIKMDEAALKYGGRSIHVIEKELAVARHQLAVDARAKDHLAEQRDRTAISKLISERNKAKSNLQRELAEVRNDRKNMWADQAAARAHEQHTNNVANARHKKPNAPAEHKGN